MKQRTTAISRRQFIGGTVATTMGLAAGYAAQKDKVSNRQAQIAITFDLEMSRHYPKRGMTEWDYQKGNLDEPTKQYAVEAARIVKKLGGRIHFFCVGRVLEHEKVDWLKEIAKEGHPIGNHTYDHVNVHAQKLEQTQFRFRRSPWLIRGRSAQQLIRENIKMTSIAMKQRVGIEENGFRTPGGFNDGISSRPDLQKLFVDLGFSWISSKYPRHLSGKPMQEPSQDVYQSIVQAQKEAQPFLYPNGLVEIPMSPISDVGAFRTKFWKLKFFMKAIRMAVEWAIETGGVFDFLCHPSCMVVEDPNHETIRMICEVVRQASEKAAIADLGSIAARVNRRAS
jgi:peptidoglycan/xylan/chitin deacetylase (PgdA/CDA1 family)